jgi:hypothetical protein
MDIISIIIQLVVGALGGNAAGAVERLTGGRFLLKSSLHPASTSAVSSPT